MDWALLPLSTRGLLLSGVQQSQGVIPLQHCLVLGLNPYCGLPVHCVGIGTTWHSSLRHPRADPRGALHSHTYSGCQSLLTNGYEGRGVQTIDTRHICHPCCSRRGDGDVDRFPCIFLCRTLPSVELRIHISFPGVLLYGHPLLTACFTRCIWCLLTWFNHTRAEVPGSIAVDGWTWSRGHQSTERQMHTTAFRPWGFLVLLCLRQVTLLWKTPPEMVILSTTLGPLTSLSDGKGHAGKVLQHSHAGGYELLSLYSHSNEKDIIAVPGSLWVGVPPMSTRHPRGILCSSSGWAASPQLTLTLGQPKPSGNISPEADIPCPLSPGDLQAMTIYVHTAGRCCLYRGAVLFDTPLRWLPHSLLSTQ